MISYHHGTLGYAEGENGQCRSSLQLVIASMYILLQHNDKGIIIMQSV